MTMTPLQLFKCLSDPTRLYTTLLIAEEGELCVCELTCALDISQPKISRHLAQLRECGVLQDQRRGQWVHYRLHPQLAPWAQDIIRSSIAQVGDIAAPLRKIHDMGGRPQRAAQCC